MSLILGIDTSSVDLGIGLYKNSEAIASFSRYVKNSHAEHISQITELLFKITAITPDQIERIAISIGPGSFTGLRIGIAFIKGFCLGRSLPILQVSSLESIAASGSVQNGPVTVAIDARRDEIFFANFIKSKNTIIRLSDDCITTIQSFSDSIQEGVPIITDTLGYTRSTAFDFLKSNENHYPVEKFPLQRGLGCARIASMLIDSSRWQNAEDVLPNYLRRSAAQDALKS